MPRLLTRQAARSRCLVFVSLFCLLTGCGSDQIRSYTVPPVASTEEPPTSAQPQGDPTHTMLAAIVRGPDRAWFFKLTATAEQTAEISSAVDTLLDSISFASEATEPSWQLPEGWTERGPSGMRFNTIVPPTDGDPCELTVTGLSSSDDWQRLVLDNLNRWRGQMQLGPTTQDQLSKLTRPLATAPEGSVAMKIEGWSPGGGMGMPPLNARAPFANGMATLDAPATASADQKSTPFTFDLPEGWVEDAPTPMRLANLRTAGNRDAPSVKVFAFPATGAMGDPLANVNRWRGQVGLEPVTQEQLDKEITEFDLAGAAGQLVELVGPNGEMLAAMSTRGAQVWFYKLDGPEGTIREQRQAFLGWLESIRFSSEAP